MKAGTLTDSEVEGQCDHVSLSDNESYRFCTDRPDLREVKNILNLITYINGAESRQMQISAWSLIGCSHGNTARLRKLAYLDAARINSLDDTFVI